MSTLTWTELPDKSGKTMTKHTGDWAALVDRLTKVGEYPSKASCPWIKGASFGTKRSAQGSLRHNANVLEIYSIEADYDAEIMPIEDAQCLMEILDIKAALYPSPSSTKDKPRWRVICPLSTPHAPAARAALVARLNGALGGILAPESFTLSQGFYFGKTPTNDYAVLTSDGQCIDLAQGLTPIFKRGATAEAPAKADTDAFDMLVDAGTINDLRSALDFMPSDDRVQWVDVGLALKALGEQGRDLWLEWSEKSAKFDADDASNKWESFSPTKIGYQTVFHMAQGAGWVNPKGHTQTISADDFEDLVQAAKDAPEPHYKLLYSDDINALPPLKWCVRGVLPSTGLAAGFGPSGSGKSFLFFDMAAAIAEGKRWFGCRVEAAPVVYLVLEGEGGLNLRVRAWESHKGRKLPDNMACVVQPFNLTTPQNLADMAAVIPAGAVVFIDTLNRAAPTADENSSKDMGEILQAAKALQASTGGLVVLVHHTGKNTSAGLRGHSSLLAALDAAVEISRDGDDRRWSIAKSKDGQDGNAQQFSLETLTLYIDEYGDDYTSCVVLQQAFVGGAKAVKLNTPTKIALKALTDAIESEGVATPQSVKDHLKDDLDAYLPTKVIGEGEWREDCYLAGMAESDAENDSKRRAFSRARKALLDADLLATYDGFVWLK